MIVGRDGVAGLILFAVSLLLLVQSFSLPYLPLVPVGPGFYPRIVLVFMALTSALLVAQDCAKQRALPALAAGEAGPRRNYRMVVVVFAIVAVYIGLLPLLGFRIATGLFVAALQAALEWPRGVRQWIMLVAVSLATVLVTYLAFETYLLVLLPRGAWTDW